MVLNKLLQETQAALSVSGIDTARLDALVLLEFVTGKNRAWLLAHPENQLTLAQQRKFARLIKKRIQRVPLAYLVGEKEFYGLKLHVSSDVLIPRPETESLVALALELNIEQAKVLDVGTGSGAVAIAIAKHRPDWNVIATDISPAALAVARANAKTHKVKVKFTHSDLFNKVKGQFDIITANLPYISTAALGLSPETNYEPSQALFAGPDGLAFYRRMFTQISPYSKPNGLLILEANPSQHKAIIGLAKDQDLAMAGQQGFVIVFQQN